MIHPTYKLNGRIQTQDSLYAIAYSFIKEGEDWAKGIGNFIIDLLDAKEFIIAHTSGSTGTPKEIQLKKEHLFNSAQATATFLDLPASTDALLCLPISYIAGKMMFVRAMVLGWNLDIVKSSSTPFEKIRKRYDFTALTPMQASASLDDIHKSKIILLGGGVVPQSLVNNLQGKHTYAYHSYGMTETCSHVAMRSIYPTYQETFTALPEVRFEKDDRDCLIINAPQVTEHPLITNDVVELHDETSFTWLGRYDQVINTGGIKVFPEEIERVLSSVIPVPFFITAMPHDELGEQVTLVIESNEKLPLDFSGLSSVQRPKKIVFQSQLKRSHTGKIIKRLA